MSDSCIPQSFLDTEISAHSAAVVELRKVQEMMKQSKETSSVGLFPTRKFAIITFYRNQSKKKAKTLLKFDLNRQIWLHGETIRMLQERKGSNDDSKLINGDDIKMSFTSRFSVFCLSSDVNLVLKKNSKTKRSGPRLKKRDAKKIDEETATRSDLLKRRKSKKREEKKEEIRKLKKAAKEEEKLKKRVAQQSARVNEREKVLGQVDLNSVFTPVVAGSVEFGVDSSQLSNLSPAEGEGGASSTFTATPATTLPAPDFISIYQKEAEEEDDATLYHVNLIETKSHPAGYVEPRRQTFFSGLFSWMYK